MKSSIDLQPELQLKENEFKEHDLLSTPTNGGDLTITSDNCETKSSEKNQRQAHLENYSERRAFDVLQRMKEK